MPLIIPPASATLASTLNLVTNDSYIINQGITVSSNIAAMINATNAQINVNVAVYGNVFHSGATTIALMANNTSVTVGSTGVINNFGTVGGEISVRLGTYGSLLNLGVIRSANTGVQVDGAEGIVSNGGTIFGAGYGISSAANTQVTNTGTIEGRFTAVDLFGSFATLINSGLVTSGSSAVVMGAEGYLSNSGQISNNTASTSSFAMYFGTNATVENTGTMSGKFGVVSAAAGLALVNDGLISSGPGYQAIEADSGTLDNAGVIRGTVSFTSDIFASTIANSGSILGDISFGAGGGTFTDAGGTVSGIISGGGGNDRFYVTEASIRIIDTSFLDLDVVQSTVSFELGDRLERLELLGSAISGVGNLSNNTLVGNGMGNILAGQSGDDAAYGLAGQDSLFGGFGNDLLAGGDDNDLLQGGIGNDQLSGDEGDDILRGMTGNDALTGGIDDDTLFGGAGNDALTGGDGDDILYGGAGQDSLYGGLGADTFAFAKGDTGKTVGTRDTILTFLTGVDRLDLSRLDANTTNANPNDTFIYLNTGAFTNVAGQLHVTGTGTFLVLEGDTNGDGLADFQIGINGLAALAIGDLIL